MKRRIKKFKKTLIRRVDATNSPLVAKYPGMLLDYSTVHGSGRIVKVRGVEHNMPKI